MLPREADPAVQLNVVLRVEDLSPDSVRCGDRGGEPRAVQIVGARRVPGCRGGLLGVDEHVRGMVLDRLEGADGAAELLAHLGVFDGHLQTRPADADRLGRRQDPEHGSRLAGRAAQHSVLGDRHAAQCDGPDAAGGVQRLQRRDGDAVGASASTTTTSSPAMTTSRSASGAPRTAGLSPVTTRSEPIVTLPDTASAPTVLPSASPGSSCARTESDAQRSMTTAAATLGRNGPGHSSWPWASSTTASSASPKPEPPCSSAIARPVHPRSAAADQTSAGWEDPLVERRAGGCPAVHPVELAKRRVGEVGVFLGDGKG